MILLWILDIVTFIQPRTLWWMYVLKSLYVAILLLLNGVFYWIHRLNILFIWKYNHRMSSICMLASFSTILPDRCNYNENFMNKIVIIVTTSSRNWITDWKRLNIIILKSIEHHVSWNVSNIYLHQGSFHISHSFWTLLAFNFFIIILFFYHYFSCLILASLFCNLSCFNVVHYYRTWLFYIQFVWK